MTDTARSTFVRWLKFNAVGAIGIAVQLAALALLVSVLRLNYLPATALAVEATVLHNFAWHERFTWADRRSVGIAQVFGRLLRFNLTNGLISIAGNLLLMRLLAGQLHVPYLLANVLTIACCAVLNFIAADRLVFATRRHFRLTQCCR
jgi:putative flippase GtrA